MVGPSVIPGGAARLGLRGVLGVGKLFTAAKTAELAGDAAKAAELGTRAAKYLKIANEGGDVSAGLLFGLSQAQQTKETALTKAQELEAKGDLQGAQEMRAKANGIAPYLTGAIEAMGEYFGTKYLSKLLRIDESEILKHQSWGEFAKDFLKSTGVEVGTEMGQQYGEAGVEKLSGIRPEAQPWEEAKSVIAPTIGLTVLTAGLGHGASKLAQKITPQPAAEAPLSSPGPAGKLTDVNILTGEPTRTLPVAIEEGFTGVGDRLAGRVPTLPGQGFGYAQRVKEARTFAEGVGKNLPIPPAPT